MGVRSILFVLCVSAPVLAQGPVKPKESPQKNGPPAERVPGKGVPDEAREPDKGYPTLNLERKGSGADVIRTARKVQDEARCGRCRGDGMVEVEEVKYPKSNPRSNVPFKEGVKRTRKEKCDKCGGTGLTADRSLELAMDNLTKAMAALKPEDPKCSEAMDRATECLQAAFKDKHDAAAKSFGELAKRRTNDQPLKTGVPVYWVGYLLDDPAAGEGRPLRVSVSRGSLTAVCWVSEPVLCRAAKGERVVVGGLFAGRQTVRENESVAVAQGGWVVMVQ